MIKYWMLNIHHGDCLVVLRTLADNSIDAVVTDPPYGLNFMGKKWDYDLPNPLVWIEVLRVLKPGGHMLAFGGSRTSHRLVCAIEDAGFEIRDTLMWITGQGFPKNPNHLKPAHEPICLARKPLSERTVASNVLRWGVGGLNIDASRVGTEDGGTHCGHRDKDGKCLGHRNGGRSTSGETFHGAESSTGTGRYPANVILDGSDEVLEAFAAFGESKSISRTGKRTGRSVNGQPYGMAEQQNVTMGHSDSGSPARFFYSAKASAGDRAGSKHPTVKPIKLMEYLCRMICPKDGTILDPFAGSGTTGAAAMNLGLSAMLIERELEYYSDCVRRLSFWM